MNGERPNILDNGHVRPMTDAEWEQYQQDIANAPETPEEPQ